jgi:hypothetical protein
MWCKFHTSGEGINFLLVTQFLFNKLRKLFRYLVKLKVIRSLYVRMLKCCSLIPLKHRDTIVLNPAAPGLESHFNLRRSQTWSPAKVMASERGGIQNKN